MWSHFLRRTGIHFGGKLLQKKATARLERRAVLLFSPGPPGTEQLPDNTCNVSWAKPARAKLSGHYDGRAAVAMEVTPVTKPAASTSVIPGKRSATRDPCRPSASRRRVPRTPCCFTVA